MNQSRYFKQEKIGEGTYGKVYKYFDRILSYPVAIKKIKIEEDECGVPFTALREIASLKTLKHPNIIDLLDLNITESHIFLIFPYLKCDLTKVIKEKSLSILASKRFLYMILDGLSYSHSKRIIHRDLKPSNILVDDQNLALADFGLSRIVRLGLQNLTREVITLWYRAPEVLLGEVNYEFSVDIWSVGCIFAEMITFKPLFAGDSEIDQIFKIFYVLGTPNDEYFENLPHFKKSFPKWTGSGLDNLANEIGNYGVDLMKKMLCLDPRGRITAFEALSHPFFKDLS